VEHVSRYNGLLHVEASRVRVSQSDLKTGESGTVDGVCGTIVEVALRLS
jgi:riboflavin synthase alpha subunit